MKVSTTTAALMAIALVNAQAAAWAQCGGSGYTGSTTCVSGYYCAYSNAYYSQCLPNEFCGQWDYTNTAVYTLYNNLWGSGSATAGSQCTGLDGTDGSTIRWHTSWTWQGGSTNVKSYANAALAFTPKKLSALSTIPTSWTYTYSNTDNMVANVAYDIFTSSTSSGTPEYEVMIWLGAYGGAGPISSTGSTIASTYIDGVTWKLYKGTNSQLTVFSFVASNAPVTSWSGDVNNFIKYLTGNQGLPSSQYLTTIEAGTEPFTNTAGVKSTLKVTAYSVAVN
ncbi:hypothetical protein TWF481_007619 [Arthrobotrys musiformis]|uniref:CBM1 domain-containing protein n=1 Tax=Arthrobotrys musiformis TaxID=47236 RepID=A0AAV9WHR2_9PEZI